MSYILVKNLHVLFVIVTMTLFLIRGVMLAADSPLLKHRVIRVVPHVNDTLLLVAAIWLALEVHQYPFVHDWLTAKVVALVCYIGLGLAAFRFVSSKRGRLACWAMAVVVFGYMIGVAISKNPWVLL